MWFWLILRQWECRKRHFVFEIDSGDLAGKGFVKEPGKLFSSGLMRKSRVANIGNAISAFVRKARARSVSQVNAKRVGRAETGAFADENGDGAGTEKVANFISDGDTALADDDEGSEGEMGSDEGAKVFKKGNDVALDGEGG